MSTLPRLHCLYATSPTWYLGESCGLDFHGHYVSLSLSFSRSISFFLRRCSCRSPWLIFYWLITQNSSSFDSEPSSWLPATSWQERDVECCSECEIDWLSERASESSALRVGSDCLGMRHHAFQKENVCFADVKRPRSSAVLLIWFWHFLGPLWTQTFALRLGNPLFLLFWPNVLNCLCFQSRTQVEKLMLKEKHRMSWQWMTVGHLRSLLEHHKRPRKPHMNSMLNGCIPTLHTRWGTFHHFEIYNIQHLRHGGGTRCRCEWKRGTEASRFRLWSGTQWRRICSDAAWRSVARVLVHCQHGNQRGCGPECSHI